MKTLTARAIGLGYRPELASELLAHPEVVGFCEVVAESCYAQSSTRAEALALSELWPVIPHGVKLSLGSADGLDEARLGQLATLAKDLRAPVVSEHVAFTRGGTREIGHLTQLPRTREAVRIVARNVAHARRRLPDIPLLLENVAFTFRWPEDELDEASFYQEVTKATGCPLLLDVSNLYANAVNEGRDPLEVLRNYPLERVAMLHVAGGVWEHGFYFDTHAHPIPSPVMQLVGEALRHCPEAPILLERDGNFGAFDELVAELRAMQALRPQTRGSTPEALESPLVDMPAATSPIERQRAVAELLTQVSPPVGALAESIGLESLARTRTVLERKRVDDALPLLGHLGRHLVDHRARAEAAVRSSQRAPRGAGPRDALAIASAFAADSVLHDEASRDTLLLRARFSGPDSSGAMRPRRGLFFGSAVLADGSRLHAVKLPGTFAQIHLFSKDDNAPWLRLSRSLLR